MTQGENWTIRCGDALALLRDLGTETVDAVVTDPPYSSKLPGETAAQKYVFSDVKTRRPDFVGEHRDQRSYLTWCSIWMAEALRIAVAGAPLMVFSDWRQLPTVTDAVQVAGWTWRGIVVWDKTEAARPHLGRFRAQAEYVTIASKGKDTHTKHITLPGVFRHSRRKDASKYHLTGKPVELMRDLLGLVVDAGTVLDPFAGSGTTGVAALETGRGFIGFELSEEYVRIARARLGSGAPRST